MDKNAWFSFLHNLHNIVRNGKGIKLTGIPALNEINNFLLLKFLEPKIDEYGLPDNCKFSVLYENYCTDEKIKQDEKAKNLKDKNYYNLWDEYCNVRGSDPNNDAVIKLFVGHDIISKYIKNDVSAICTYIDKPESGINIQKLINAIYKKYDEIAKIKKKHINDLTLDDWNFDAFGLAYEQWKSESVSEKGKKTGQHFTPIELKTWMMKELNPKASETFYEPACGTGGFITIAYKYIKDTKQDIKKFRNNIYANECNPEVFKPLMINMLIHEIPVDNIHSEDSLDIHNCERYKNKFDCGASNPPFGTGDAIPYSDYWGALKGSNKKVIKDFIAQFLMHIVNSMKKGGRWITVMDRGLLNNGYDGKSWENNFRKWLIENVNITKIVLNPKGIFDYTGIATAEIAFTKGEKTKEIKFYHGKFKDEKNFKGFYVEEEPFEVRTYNDLVKNGYNLKVDKDEEKEVVDEDIEYVKLGDIITSNNGGEIIDKEYFNKGTKILWTCSNENIYTNYENFPNNKLTTINDLLLPRNGSQIPYVKIPSNNNLYTNVVSRIQFDNKKYLTKFIFYVLNLNVYDFINNNPNTIPSYNMDLWKNRNIPNISLDHQQEIVTLLDEQFKTYNIQKFVDYSNSNKLFKLLIYKKYDDFKDAMHLIYRKIESDAIKAQFEKDKKAIFNWLVKSVECESKKLGDICDEIRTGKNKPTDNKKGTKYPYYGTGGITGYTDEFLVDGDYILCARNGTVGQSFLISGKSYPSDHMFIIKNIKTNIYYLYYLLKWYNNYVSISNGGGILGITKISLSNILLNIPSKENQQKIIDQVELINIQQESYKQYGDLLEKQITQIFETIDTNYFKNEKEYINEEETNEEDTEESEEDEEPQPKKELTKEIKKVVEEEKPKKTTTKGSKSKSNVI